MKRRIVIKRKPKPSPDTVSAQQKVPTMSLNMGKPKTVGEIYTPPTAGKSLVDEDMNMLANKDPLAVAMKKVSRTPVIPLEGVDPEKLFDKNMNEKESVGKKTNPLDSMFKNY